MIRLPRANAAATVGADPGTAYQPHPTLTALPCRTAASILRRVMPRALSCPWLKKESWISRIVVAGRPGGGGLSVKTRSRLSGALVCPISQHSTRTQPPFHGDSVFGEKCQDRRAHARAEGITAAAPRLQPTHGVHMLEKKRAAGIPRAVSGRFWSFFVQRRPGPRAWGGAGVP